MEKSRKRPVVAGAIFGLVIALATAAIAAVITLTTTQVGSGIVSVTACDTAYAVDPGTPVWDATAGDFVISDVTYSGIDAACAGEFVRVEVLDASNASLASGGGLVGASGSGTLSLTANVPVGSIADIASTLYTP